MKRLLTWASGPILAIVFLWLCFRGADVHELARQVRATSLPLLVIVFFSGVLHLMLRSWRWGTLLEPARARQDIPYVERMSAVSIGNMALILPGRVGEVLRPALLSRRVGLPFGTALASVGVERIVLDLLTVVTFGAVGLMLPARWSGVGSGSDPQVVALIRSSGLVVFVVALAGLVVVAWSARQQSWITERLQRAARGTARRFLNRLLIWLATLLPGLKAFASPRGLVRLAVESLIIWSVIAAGIHIGIIACGITLAPFSSLVILPILAVGIGIPTPGGAGSYHYAMKLGLVSLFGADEEMAQATALVVHAMSLLPMLFLGGLFVARGGLTRKGTVPVLSGAGVSQQ